MGSVTLNSNVSALSAARQLGRSTAALGQAFTRLSSGLRINRASDDASGLAIASSLNTDARVFNQGVRNLNDGISLLSIAEGALSEMSNIMFRLSELSSQAANGTLSSSQRNSLDQEADALVQEYNRILSTAAFNGRDIFSLTDSRTSLQAGYSSLTLELGQYIQTLVPSGTFSAVGSFSAGDQPTTLALGDYNEDGFMDVVVGDYNNTNDKLGLLFSNGDGTFLAPISITSYFRPHNVFALDVNNDGHTDIVSNTPTGGSNLLILLGNGNGTFKASTGADLGLGYSSTGYGDFNGDGYEDFVGANSATQISLILGNGNGTYRAPLSVNGITSINEYSIQAYAAGDVNNDGKVDLIVADGGFTADHMKVLLGNGNGTFFAASSYAVGADPGKVLLADFNGDGILDAVTDGGGALNVLIGNGNGTFRARTQYSVSGLNSIQLQDMNSDGIIDIISGAGSSVEISYGNGNGTFQSAVALSTPGGGNYVVLGDINGDGLDDVVSSSYAGSSVYTQLAEGSASLLIEELDLTTQLAARNSMDQVETYMAKISAERGNIGSFLSRIGVAVTNLQQSAESYQTSAAGILDADVAHESATLVRARILQQAGAAVLSQANLQPNLALELLRGPS